MIIKFFIYLTKINNTKKGNIIILVFCYIFVIRKYKLLNAWYIIPIEIFTDPFPY